MKAVISAIFISMLIVGCTVIESNKDTGLEDISIADNTGITEEQFGDNASSDGYVNNTTEKATQWYMKNYEHNNYKLEYIVNSDIWKYPVLSRDEVEENYTPEVPTEYAKDRFEVMRMDILADVDDMSINGYKPDTSYFWDTDKMLLVFKDEKRSRGILLENR